MKNKQEQQQQMQKVMSYTQIAAELKEKEMRKNTHTKLGGSP